MLRDGAKQLSHHLRSARRARRRHGARYTRGGESRGVPGTKAGFRARAGRAWPRRARQRRTRLTHPAQVPHEKHYGLLPQCSGGFRGSVDILAHLMIGSEDTLGFISEITYRTVPEYADKASALI